MRYLPKSIIYIKRCKQQKRTLKNLFLKQTIIIRFILLHVCPFMRPFVFALFSVVSKMVILAHSSNFQNCIKKTNKIPEYVRDFKNEYLFIRCINKEFKYVVENINEATRGLFENHRVDKIKKFIKKFLLAQKLGYFNDISNFEILINIFNFVKIVMMKMIKFLLILILVLKTFMMITNYFVVSLK